MAPLCACYRAWSRAASLGVQQVLQMMPVQWGALKQSGVAATVRQRAAEHPARSVRAAVAAVTQRWADAAGDASLAVAPPPPVGAGSGAGLPAPPPPARADPETPSPSEEVAEVLDEGVRQRLAEAEAVRRLNCAWQELVLYAVGLLFGGSTRRLGVCLYGQPPGALMCSRARRVTHVPSRGHPAFAATRFAEAVVRTQAAQEAALLKQEAALVEAEVAQREATGAAEEPAELPDIPDFSAFTGGQGRQRPSRAGREAKLARRKARCGRPRGAPPPRAQRAVCSHAACDPAHGHHAFNRDARGRADKALAEAAEAAPGSANEGASSAAGKSAAAPSEAGEKAHASGEKAHAGGEKAHAGGEKAHAGAEKAHAGAEKAHAGGGSSRVRTYLSVHASSLVTTVPISETTALVAR